MWNKQKKAKSNKTKQSKYPMKDISIDELKKSIREYSSNLSKSIPLSVIINDDLSINYQLLAPILKAFPENQYYMSRETYEIFKEEDYQLAVNLDKIQLAVDRYLEQTNKLPVISGDPYKKVSFYKLEKLDLIDERPDEEFYITDEENLITYNKPS